MGGAADVWRGEVHLLLERHGQIEEQIRVVEAKLDALAKDDPAMALLATGFAYTTLTIFVVDQAVTPLAMSNDSLDVSDLAR